MTMEQALQYIHDHPEYYLAKARVKGYICPICGSGNGPNGTGITTEDGVHFSCWGRGSCYKSVDIPDIIALKEGLEPGSREALMRAYEVYNISITGQGDPPAPRLSAPKPPAPPPPPDEPPADYTEYFKAAHARIGETDYPQRRGLSEATVKRFGLGYDPAWRSPAALAKGYNPPPSPRLIIPTGPGNYIARDTRADIPEDQQRYKKQKEGKAALFNLEALRSGRSVFVTEGEIDALSIIEAGGEAVGLGSRSMVGAFLKTVKENKPAQPLIIALDNDDAGKEGAEELAKGLDALGIPFIQANLYGGCKDANEALTTDREFFFAAVRDMEKSAGERAAARAPAPDQEPAQTEEPAPAPPDTRPNRVSKYLRDNFLDNIDNFTKYKKRTTGFANLDRNISGLYPGLYVIGAISSLGKTTFVHQLADQLAAAGDHILFFSLEQNTFELVTKSLSRLTARSNREDLTKAVSAISIRGGNFTSPSVMEALRQYADIADRVSIYECNFDTSVTYIMDTTKQYMAANQVKPIVIVDYLQIIPPENIRQGEREKVDSIVRGLKKMQSENDLVVFVVSSINRSNYLTPIDFESFKESGGIEYTADVLWGLQLQIMNEGIFNGDTKIKEKREAVREAKKAIPRKVELLCLKNRYGISSYSCGFVYDPRFDLFEVDPAYKEDKKEGNGYGIPMSGTRM